MYRLLQRGETLCIIKGTYLRLLGQASEKTVLQIPFGYKRNATINKGGERLRYTWSGRCAFEMAALPKAAVGQLRLAGALSLRVLIWLCCAGDGEFDAMRCAADCGGSPADCEEALHYWIAQGLVALDTAKAEPTGNTALSCDSQREAKPLTDISAVFVRENALKADESAAASPGGVREQKEEAAASPADTTAGRPPLSKVIEARGRDERFAFLLETAAVKLGKPLSPADMTTYLYLYKEIGLPPEVILMVVGYAVQNGKARLSYIEKTAINWAEQGITTIAKADDYLYHLDRCRQAWETLSRWCELTVENPTVSQREAACRWIYDWKLPKEVICFTAEYAAQKTGKFQASYINRILEQLYEEGATTLEKARERIGEQKYRRNRTGTKAARMKTDISRAPSFDIGEYEQMALRHRPCKPSDA